MTPTQRLAAIAKVLDRYTYLDANGQYYAPAILSTDFRKLKQLAKPAKKRSGKR